MDLVAYVVLFASLVLWTQALFSLYLMLYTWEHPERMEASRGPSSFLPPRLSFTVLLPARHEEAVIYRTIKSVWAANYPSGLLEIVVVCHASDAGTITEARRAIREIGSSRVRVETFSENPINKPHGLNVGLERTNNEVVTIFDAEDDIHPDIFNVINTVMLKEKAGIIQSGVQLINFRDHWFSAHNCLEYFFWFKSRLHFHAKVGMIPLGGNTVFIRRNLIERVGGWDQSCLTEDADIGLRLSVLGEPIRVVYDAQHVTREETPDSVASFVKQRTRWHQGFLQILLKGSWLSLPKLGQKLLAFYTLSYSVFQGLTTLLWPLAVAALFFIDVPVPVAMVSFLPIYALLLQLAITIVGAVTFAREYDLKYSFLMPIGLAITFAPFQFLLGISAIRAVYREMRKQNNWEKTEHLGAHRCPEIVFPTEYELLLDQALNHLGAERGSVMVLDPEWNTFSVAASRGLPNNVVDSAEVGAEGVAGWVAQRKHSLIIDERSAPEGLDARLNQPELRSSIVMPIEQSDGTVAVLSLSSKETALDCNNLRWIENRVSALFIAPAESTDGECSTREKVATVQSAPKSKNNRLKSIELHSANLRRREPEPSFSSESPPSAGTRRRQLVALAFGGLLCGGVAATWLGIQEGGNSAPAAPAVVEEKLPQGSKTSAASPKDSANPAQSSSEDVEVAQEAKEPDEPTQVSSSLDSHLGGGTQTSIGETPISLSVPDEAMDSLEEVQALSVGVGPTVRDAADVEEVEAPSAISRSDEERAVTEAGRIALTDTTAVADEAAKAVATLGLPREMTDSVGDESEVTEGEQE